MINAFRKAMEINIAGNSTKSSSIRNHDADLQSKVKDINFNI